MLSTPAFAGKIADNPIVTVGGTGEDFDFAQFGGWWVRSGSTFIDFTFNNIPATTATHVLVNFDLGVTNRKSGEQGLDGLVDIIVNPGAAPGSTYTLANVLFDNRDSQNRVFAMGGGGTYLTHASILVDKNYILGGTLIIRVVRHVDANGAPVAPIGTNQPINMATQPPTVPLACYESNDGHRVHIHVATIDATGLVASADQVTIWEMGAGELVQDHPYVTVGGSGQDFSWAAFHGWWVRKGSTYVDFTFADLHPAVAANRFLLVIFSLGVTNRTNGEEGLDGLVDFIINPGTANSYTVAGELLDNMNHLNSVLPMGGGGTYGTKAVLSINRDYLSVPCGVLVIRVQRHVDADGAPGAPAGNHPIDMSTDPPTVPLGCYEVNDARRVHLGVRTWDQFGKWADTGVVTMYSKHYESTAVLMGSYSAIERENCVQVKWTTASEINNAGFNIYRSANEDGAKQKLNEALIPARGNDLQGATYTFNDYDVAGRGEYCYWFESVSLDGKATMNGPALVLRQETPKTFSLAQNYPNPFNPVTAISYDLAKDCHVKLEVYNVLGQRVATLVDEDQMAGSRIAYWNAGSELSSGMYFYRLQAGSFVEMKKMMILR
jgi:hypothetical protein